jgi:anti-sigma factor RsiW
MKIEDSQGLGCSCPPGLGGDAVIAAADGEADEATLAHLRECPGCAEQVERVRELQRRLRRQLYRLFCPATDVLVDYCHGLLDPYQRAAVVHHLALCPHCAGELKLLERAGPPPDTSGLPALARLASRLVG